MDPNHIREFLKAPSPVVRYMVVSRSLFVAQNTDQLNEIFRKVAESDPDPMVRECARKRLDTREHVSIPAQM